MGEINIRKAVISDFDFFYLIKCDEDNVYWAGHTLPPIRDELYQFYYSHIQHQDILSERTIFIVENKENGKSAGYLYLDPKGNDSAEISIAILNSCSGRGFGRLAVCELCDIAFKLGFINISAMIREDNLRSQRMFKHAGFSETELYQYQFIQNLNQKVKMIKFEKHNICSRTEIGSEFNLDLYTLKTIPNSFFQYIGDMKYCLFDSGRSALRAIACTGCDGTVLLPEYICESVIKCFNKEQIAFYRLKENLEIDSDDLLNKITRSVNAVYIMHFFGSLQPEYILSLLKAEKEKYGFTIIEDTTHSIFSKKKTVGDYCIASLRKWFALPNGGVLYSDNSINLNSYDDIQRSTDNDKAYAMILKELYNRGQLDCNSEYRTIFASCEQKLDRQKEIKRISDFSEFLLGCNDIYKMAEKRKANFRSLKNKICDIGIKQICSFSFSEEDCPFTLPVIVPDRDDFRRYLTENKIYCAVHWPFDGLAREARPLAVSLSDHILSLPIDQRYGSEDMAYILNVIDAYKGRLKF